MTDSTPRSPQRHPWLALLYLFASLGAACGGDPADRSGVAAPAGTGVPGTDLEVIEVTTAPVVRGPLAQRISAPGSLAPMRESQIGAEVRGRIVQVFVAEGDRVAEGDPLFQIDPEPYELARREAEAGVDLARAERRQTEADLARAKSLLAKSVASQQAVDRLATRLAVARAQERKAREAVSLAELNLRRTLVRSPYAGVVVERRADEGTTAQAQPQTIVVVMQETAELEGRATIPEAHLGAVQVGDRALLHVGGFPEPIETRVSSVGDAVDPATRTYEVRMRVPNPEHRFKGGVFAHVEIEPQAKQDALLIPRDALRTEEGRTRVLTVREGVVVAVPVRIGIVSDESAEVLAGLEPGELVIVGEAAQTAAPGMPVRVRGEAIAGP